MNKLGRIMIYTKEFLISELHRFYDETNRVPVAADMNIKNNYPSAGAYVRYFDSWNNALITAGFEINKRNNRLDGTETCFYCGKRADEIPNFTSWYYYDGIRYCVQHGGGGLRDYVMGMLDINSAKGLGRAGEILVAKTLKIPEEYDCNRKSCHAPTDMYHENYGKIDVKTSLLSVVSNNWKFTFNPEKDPNTYICIGLSLTRSIVKHVWILPNEGKVKNLQLFGVRNSYKGLENRKRWEVDIKPYNDTWKSMKLNNCKIMVDKSKEDYVESIR